MPSRSNSVGLVPLQAVSEHSEVVQGCAPWPAHPAGKPRQPNRQQRHPGVAPDVGVFDEGAGRIGVEDVVPSTGFPPSIPEPSNWAWRRGSVSRPNRVRGRAWISRNSVPVEPQDHGASVESCCHVAEFVKSIKRLTNGGCGIDDRINDAADDPAVVHDQG
jgi:hypothetical protein